LIQQNSIFVFSENTFHGSPNQQFSFDVPLIYARSEWAEVEGQKRNHILRNYLKMSEKSNFYINRNEKAVERGLNSNPFMAFSFDMQLSDLKFIFDLE